MFCSLRAQLQVGSGPEWWRRKMYSITENICKSSGFYSETSTFSIEKTPMVCIFFHPRPKIRKSTIHRVRLQVQCKIQTWKTVNCLKTQVDLTSHMRMNLWLKVQMKTNKMKLILMVYFCKIFKIVVKKYKHWINGVVVVIATLICYAVQENIGVVMKSTKQMLFDRRQYLKTSTMRYWTRRFWRCSIASSSSRSCSEWFKNETREKVSKTY